MTENRYVEELWAYDDIMVKDNESSEELWNNMIYERMNEQDEQIKELEKENKHLQCKIESNSQDDYIDYLKKENEQLKEELESFEQVSFTDLCDGSRTVLYMKKENVGDD